MLRILRLTLSLLTAALVGCGWKAPESIRPMNRIFEQMPTGGPAEYEQGWKDGCESGMTAHTNNFYQSFYVFKQDNSLLKNEYYYKAWQDSYSYCRLYAYMLLREANLRRSLPNESQFLGRKNQKGLLQWLEGWGPGITNRK